MLEWYCDLPSWIMYGLAITVVAIGLATGVGGMREKSTPEMRRDHPDRAAMHDREAAQAFRGGFILDVFGCILLALAPCSPSEKAGYKF